MTSVAFPNFDYEFEYSENFSRCVIGVDEVGRGALAGPVVAGAVCIINMRGESQDQDYYYKRWIKRGIDDSKRLTPKKREELSKVIQEEAVWGIGEVGVEVINKVGIVRSTHLAMIQAVESLNLKLRATNVILLVDGVVVPAFADRKWSHKPIVKGDQKSVSIAAASIIAKVFRDRLMSNLSLEPRYRNYAWIKNKGYGTKTHLEAITRFGPTIFHRRDFLRSEAVVDETLWNR